MKDETIDEKIARLEKELAEAREEKTNAILSNFLPVGTKVYVVGEIAQVDIVEHDLPYFVYFEGADHHLWVRAEEIKEVE